LDGRSARITAVTAGAVATARAAGVLLSLLRVRSSSLAVPVILHRPNPVSSSSLAM
jgi:hypothetical protein